jgi:hypothetical protein
MPIRASGAARTLSVSDRPAAVAASGSHQSRPSPAATVEPAAQNRRAVRQLGQARQTPVDDDAGQMRHAVQGHQYDQRGPHPDRRSEREMLGVYTLAPTW